MATKLTAFFVTLAINIAIGIVVLFFLLIAMNGYSESDATYGLGSYVVLAFIVSLTMASGAAFTSSLLMRRSFKRSSAVMIAVPIFSAVGAGLKLVCSIVGVLVAEFVRTNY